MRNFSILLFTLIFFSFQSFAVNSYCYSPLETQALFSKSKKPSTRASAREKRKQVTAIDKKIYALEDKLSQHLGELEDSLNEDKFSESTSDVADDLASYMALESDQWDCDPLSTEGQAYFFEKYPNIFALLNINLLPQAHADPKGAPGNSKKIGKGNNITPRARGTHNNNEFELFDSGDPGKSGNPREASRDSNINKPPASPKPDSNNLGKGKTSITAVPQGTQNDDELELFGSGDLGKSGNPIEAYGDSNINKPPKKTQRIIVNTVRPRVSSRNSNRKTSARANSGNKVWEKSKRECLSDGYAWNTKTKTCVAKPLSLEDKRLQNAKAICARDLGAWNKNTKKCLGKHSSTALKGKTSASKRSACLKNRNVWYDNSKTCVTQEDNCRNQNKAWDGKKCINNKPPAKTSNKPPAKPLTTSTTTVKIKPVEEITKVKIKSVKTLTPATKNHKQCLQKQGEWKSKTRECCNKTPDWKSSNYFKSNGKINASGFCNDYATTKSRKSCKRAIDRMKKTYVALNRYDQQKQMLEDEADELEYSSLTNTDTKLSKTEASGLCFECLKKVRKYSQPTSSEKFGSALSIVTGSFLSMYGLKAARSAQNSANQTLIQQGFAAQPHHQYSFAGLGMGFPFINNGLYGLTKPNTPRDYTCAPSYSPYGY